MTILKQAIGDKFDLVITDVNVNLGISLERTWWDPNTNAQGLYTFGFREEDFWKVFTTHERSNHLEHVTQTICIKFRSPTLMSLDSNFIGKVVSEKIYFNILVEVQFELFWFESWNVNLWHLFIGTVALIIIN